MAKRNTRPLPEDFDFEEWREYVIANLGGGGGGPHTHPISDVTSLQAALDAKQASGSYAAAVHSHTIANVTGLQTALDGKQAAGSYATLADISDRALASRLINTTAPLTGGGDLSANRTLGINTFSGLLPGAVPTSAGGTTNFLRADGAWAAPGGGSDPWAYVKLASDFTTSSATAVSVTGLAFTPGASKTYIVEGFFLTRTATATVGPRPGVNWPTGTTDGAMSLDMTSAATTRLLANGNPSAAMLSAVGGVPTTTGSWPANLWGTLITGASPSGALQVTLASETAGTVVTMKAGSWIRYREI